MSEWIPWRGKRAVDEMPMNLFPGDIIIAKYRDGTQETPLRADRFRWDDRDNGQDIIAYRVFTGMVETGGPDVIGMLIAARGEDGNS